MDRHTDSTNDRGSAAAPKTISVLFVCLGNICRSPMAHAYLEHMTRSKSLSAPTNSPTPLTIRIDSAGTGAWHLHAAPDPRTLSTLESHAITDFHHAARKVRDSDFDDFDYILAMDGENLQNLEELERRRSRKRGKGKAKVSLFSDFGEGRGKGEEIDDPYYGGDDGFERAFEQCSTFSRRWLSEVSRKGKEEQKEEEEEEEEEGGKSEQRT